MSKCKICGLEKVGHPECEACGCFCERNHSQVLSSYRGHNICGTCEANWRKLDRVIKRSSTWEEFLRPPMSIFPPLYRKQIRGLALNRVINGKENNGKATRVNYTKVGKTFS